MEHIINKIQSILQKFNILQFEIQPKNKKVIFEEIDVSYQDAVNDLELMLQNIYLQGNNLTLKRVREEIFKIKMILLNDSNVGLTLYDENQTFLGIVEPKDIANVNNLKIDYVNQLIRFLDNYLELSESEEETPTFNNNFDNITPAIIYKHFKAGLVEKGFLNEKELYEYLKTAFEFKKVPDSLFKIKDAPNKRTIEAVFYNYYKNVAGKIQGKQKKYAALLGDYFEGYKTTTVSSNFSKSVY